MCLSMCVCLPVSVCVYLCLCTSAYECVCFVSSLPSTSISLCVERLHLLLAIVEGDRLCLEIKHLHHQRPPPPFPFCFAPPATTTPFKLWRSTRSTTSSPAVPPRTLVRVLFCFASFFSSELCADYWVAAACCSPLVFTVPLGDMLLIPMLLSLFSLLSLLMPPPVGFWSKEISTVEKTRVSSRICAASWTNDGQYIALGHFNGNVSIRNQVGQGGRRHSRT